MTTPGARQTTPAMAVGYVSGSQGPGGTSPVGSAPGNVVSGVPVDAPVRRLQAVGQRASGARLGPRVLETKAIRGLTGR